MTCFTLGEYRGVILDVGHFTINAATLFANAPADLLAAALKKWRFDADGLVFRMKPLLIDTGRNRVLIDPGTGDDPGRLLSALKAEGIDPGTVDTVIVTHGHADHYSGCIDAQGRPAFPQARYYMQRAEWQHWLSDPNPEPHHAETFRRLLVPLQDRFTLLDGDAEIVPGITAEITPGHSPGHMIVVIGGRLVCVADMLVNVIYVAHPDWFAAFDVQAAEVVQGRKALIKRLAREHLWVYGYHFATPGTGRIVADGAAWQWMPETMT